MSASETEPKSSLTEKENQFGNTEKERNPHNKQLKNLQPDGRKISRTNTEQNQNRGDMSHEDARNLTFENFPKKILIDRIIDSGFFYTGKGDTTQCHKCNAVVEDWNDKDDPAAFHEPDCEFFMTPHKSNAVNHENGLVDKDLSLEDKAMSILDTPITEPNNNTLPVPVLTPTIVRSRSHGVPMVRELLTTVESTSSHNSLPSFAVSVKEEQAAGKSKLTKEYVKKVKPKPYSLTKAITNKDYEELLKTLNLYSEEDRRKTFLYKRSWSENTNNVIPPNILAADGFYYLGDRDRTQCFSCDKIFKLWLRNDNVNKIHRNSVVYCKMAQRKDRQNIAIPAFQAVDDYSSTTSSSNLDTLPTLAKPSGELSTSSNIDMFLPSVQIGGEDDHTQFLSSASSLQISKSTASKQSEDVSENETSSGMQAQEPQTEISQGPASHGANNLPQTSSGQPLDLTINKNLKKLSETLHNIKDSSRKDVPIKFPDERSMELETQSSVPPSIDEHHRAQEEQHFPVEPTFEEGILPEENHSVGSNIGTSIMESSYSEVRPGHIDHGTLDNNPSSFPTEAMELSPGSGPFASPTEVPRNSMQVSEAENPYPAAFPCNEPIYPQMCLSEQRRETYMNVPTLGSINQEEFISAGFYYNRPENQLECWYCGGGITRWNTVADPWDFHAYRFPHCEFVLQQKGPDFVAEASRRGRPMTPVSIEPMMSFPRFTRRASDSDEYSSNSSIESPPSSPSAAGARRILFNWVGRRGMGRSQSPPTKVVDPREEEAVKKKKLESALNSEVTVSVIDMGFDIQAIKKAYKRRIETTGENFPTADALLDVLLTQSPVESESSDESEEEEEEEKPSSSVDPPSSAGAASAAQGGDVPAQDFQPMDEKEQESKMREFEQEKRCKVCLDRDAEVVFMPCGHLCTCIECANALRTCPLCRKKIQKAMKIYTS